MITTKTKLTNQLLSKIHFDKNDPTVIRVDIHNIAFILSSFNYNLPSRIFENKLEQLLNKKLTGARVTEGLKHIIADMIVSLANKLHVSDDEIQNYIMNHQKPEDAAEIQNKIKEWRKTYYGSMDKAEKEALLEALHGKLRPDVLDQIKRA
ncbi:MAG: hypothetical protein KDH96_05345 [Candidatus Riesia sp.]|nr:hypothetical protein [Candidatus Riesia sp.]